MKKGKCFKTKLYFLTTGGKVVMYSFKIKHILSFLLLVLILPLSLAAQGKGTISGKVIDAETGEVLRRATISLVGTKVGVYSDVKGEYKLRDITSGKHTIMVSYVGYKSRKIEDIELKEGQTLVFNITLESATSRTEEVVVEARRENNNEAAILVQRKNAAQVSDGISIEEIKRTADSDAGQSLRRVTGVTLVDNKFIYVRGVSERYSNTTLNGTALASTETDKKAFAFDMFPSEFLENANVAKSFTPDMPGNFAGGLVQLNTVDFPSARSFKISFGTSMSDNLTFDNKFMTYQGTNSLWAGDKNTHSTLPSNFPNSPMAMGNLLSRLKSDDEAVLRAATAEWEALGKSLNNNNWKRDTIKAPLNGSMNISYADIFRIGEGDFGIIASAIYDNSYAYEDLYRATTVTSGEIYNFNSGTNSTFSTGLGGLLNMSYKIGTNSSISWKNTYNSSAEEKSTILLGRKDQVLYRQYASQFLEKTLLSSQFGAEHNLEFLNNSLFDWKFGFSNSKRNEPDLKTLRYSRTDESQPYSIDIYDVGSSTYQAGRQFSNLNEDALTAAFNFTLPIDNIKIKTGFLWENKERDFIIRTFTLNKGTTYATQYYDEDFEYIVPNYGDEEFYNSAFVLEPEYLFGNPDNYSVTRLGLSEATGPGDSYRADESVFAGYLMSDIPFMVAGKKLRLIAGARIEQSSILLNTYYRMGEDNNFVTIKDKEYLDVLPSINLVYELTKEMNLRMTASQTLTRPSLRELSPTAYYDFYFQRIVRGNPKLVRTLIQNYDIRWELFQNPGEVISVSLFYKSFKNAIEETLISAGGASNPMSTFMNANGLATVYGVEFESRKNLGFISDIFRYFSANLNVAFMKSNLSVNQINIKDVRPMQGQSPYTANIGLFYFNPEIGTSVNLGYNVAGKKIVLLTELVFYEGVSDPHVYEMPRNLVDLSITQTVLKTIDLKFVVRDLLNETTTWEQLGKVVSKTSKGRSISFGIGYKL